jgi:hypothetical protein
VDTNTKAADPGNFKDKQKWPEWQKSFVNYLSLIPGLFGVPLAYVVCENKEPNLEEAYLNFTEKMIASAPLFGQFYEEDLHCVHNLLTSFLQGKNTETWIQSLARYNDGRHNMTALHRHYAGESNTTRWIGDAKRIQNTLLLGFSWGSYRMCFLFSWMREKGSNLLSAQRLTSFCPRLRIPLSA